MQGGSLGPVTLAKAGGQSYIRVGRGCLSAWHSCREIALPFPRTRESSNTADPGGHEDEPALRREEGSYQIMLSLPVLSLPKGRSMTWPKQIKSLS